jgi:hypothetical protein
VVDERGVVGWVLLVIALVVFAVVFGLCKLVIPGDGNDDNGKSPALTSTSVVYPGVQR